MGPTTRTKKRPRRCVTIHDSHRSEGQDAWEVLPKEVLDIITGKLSASDIKSASLACKKWVKLLRNGISDLTTTVRVFTDDPSAFEGFSLPAIVPNLQTLHLDLTPRSNQEALSRYLGTLDALQRLKHLTLTFWVPTEAKRGMFPVFFAEAMKAPQLQSLRLNGSPLPGVAMQALSKIEEPLNQLSELIFEPNSFPGGELCSVAGPSWSQLLLPTSNKGTLPTATAAALPTLAPNLQRLCAQVARDAEGGWMQGVAGLPKLTSLQLSTEGSWLFPCPRSVLVELDFLLSERLQELSIHISGADASEALYSRAVIPQMKQLKRLDLKLTGWSSTQVTKALGVLLEEHPAMPQLLHSLALSPGSSDPGVMAAIGKCVGLRRLQLRNCHVEEVGAEAQPQQEDVMNLGQLSTLTALEVLEVAESGLTDSVQLRWPLALGRSWPRLRELSLSSSSMTLEGVGSLWQWPHLTHLGVTHLQPAQPQHEELEPLVHVDDLGQKLECLSLEGYTLLMSRGRRGNDLQQLRHLELKNCSVVSCSGRRRSRHQQPTHALQQLLSATPKLQLLQLSGVLGLTDNDFPAIGQLTALTTLSVMAVGNPDVTQGALVSLSALQQLQVLRWHVGDNAESTLPHLPTLKAFQRLLCLLVTPQMDRQMERWRGYNMLDDMPACDVMVEWGCS